MENKKGKKKPFYIQLWFWIIWLVLCAINIICSIIFDDKMSNLFTSISGWVSGIATVVLGIIAVRQTDRYEESNNTYLAEQRKIQQDIANENKKQNEFAIRMLKAQDLQKFNEEIKNDVFNLLSENLAISFKCSVIKTHQNIINKEKVECLVEFSYYCEDKRTLILNALLKVRNSNYLIKYSKELFIEMTKLSDLYYELEMKYGENIANWNFIEKELFDDIEKIKKSEGKIRELLRDNLYEYQAIINYVSDMTVTYDECVNLFNKLARYKSEIQNQLVEWIQATMVYETKEDKDNG